MESGKEGLDVVKGNKDVGLKKGIDLEIQIPEGIEVNITDNVITVHGKMGKVERKFPSAIDMLKKDSLIILSSDSERKRQKAILGAYNGHIKNMIHGVSDGIVYKLKIVYSHFPMGVKVSGKEVIIDNFLGEKHPRTAKILEGVSVDVKGQDITVTGIDKEKVAQTAANMEQTTRIKNRDPRVFQDGCYIVQKDGKVLS